MIPILPKMILAEEENRGIFNQSIKSEMYKLDID